jgi:competence/damage-inducible protein CinA-like protein
MPSCEIITIGTELLLGEITDTNSRYLARALRDLGIDLYRKTTIGDNARRIAQAIQEALARSDIILTTGGLGPTVDDPTREAVALAVGSQVEFRPELWEQIQRRFERFGRQPTENNKRQAYIPAGAIPVENVVGTAPAFFYETHNGKVIISLPGVPREMEHLLLHKVTPYLRQRYDLRGIIKARVLHTSGLGESVIDEMIGDLETLTNPTVGLAAHSGQVDVRITAKAASEAEADVMIAGLETTIRQRLEKAIYGVDQESLETAAAKNLQDRGWRLAVVEYGLGGELLRRLASALFGDLAGGQVLAEAPEPEERRKIVEAYRSSCAAEAALGVFLTPAGEKQDIFIILTTPVGVQEFARPYGGPPSSAPAWGVNHSLDILRKF